METKSKKEISLVVKDRWRSLKEKYSFCDLNTEYKKWIEWRRSNGKSDPPPSVLTLQWFESDRLKNKPMPIKLNNKKMPSYSEKNQIDKQYFFKEKNLILGYMTSAGLPLDEATAETVRMSVSEEGLSFYSFKEMASGNQKPVYPNTKILIHKLASNL